MFRRVPLRFRTTLSVSERAAASVAEWDVFRRVGLRMGKLGLGLVCKTTIVRARRPIDAAVVGCDEVR